MHRLRIGLLALATSLITSVLALGTATSATAAGTIETVLQFQPAAVFRDSSGAVTVPASVRLLNKATGAEIPPSAYGDSVSIVVYNLDGSPRGSSAMRPSTDSGFGFPFSFGDMDVAASFDGYGNYAAARSPKYRVTPDYNSYTSTTTLGTTPTTLTYGESVTVPVTVSSTQVVSDRIRGRGTLFVDGVAKPWFPITGGAGQIVIDGDLLGVPARPHAIRVSFTGGGAVEFSNSSVSVVFLRALSKVEVTDVPATSVYGKTTKLATKVTTTPAWPSKLGGGKVTAYDGSDRTTPIGAGTVVNDLANVELDAMLGAGQHDVQLVFTPSPDNSEADYVVTSPPTSQSVAVQKLTPSIGLRLLPSRVTSTGASTARVIVDHATVPVDKMNGGSVSLLDANGNTVGQPTALSNGVADITIPAGTFGAGTTNAVRARLTTHPNLAMVTSFSENLVVLNKFESAVSLPTISAPKGSRVGETVGVVEPNPAWTPTTPYKYQWLLDGDPLKNADGTDATGTTYVIKASDVRGLGKGQLQVRVTSTRADYEETSQVSAAMRVIGTATVSKPTLSDPTAVKVGKQVTATVTGWPANTQWKYEWFVGGTSKGAASTTNTYTPVPADAEKPLTVRVTGTPDGFDPVSETSEASTVIGVFQTEPAPTISSSTSGVRVGSVLTANVDDWSPTQGSFTYQWFRSGKVEPVGVGKTYTVTSEDKTQTLRVEATGHRNGYDDAMVSSSATAAVTEGKFDSTDTRLSDVPLKGVPVKASTEFWSPKLTGAEPQYQWYLGTTATNGTPITDAVASSYTPLDSDVGKYLSVKVTGTLPGYETVSATSEPVKVRGVDVDRHVTISGSGKVGTTVTATAAGWPAGTALRYQWLRAGTPIAGATRASYALTAGDFRRSVAVRVTAPGTDLTATSGSLTVTAGTMKAGKVKVSGRAKVGRTVKAATSGWTAGTKLTYQWFRNGVAIGKATKSKYKVTKKDKRKKITVRVTATATGYTTAVKTSAPVRAR